MPFSCISWMSVLSCLLLLQCQLWAVQAERLQASPKFDYRNAIEGRESMDLRELDPTLARVLQNYYIHSLGGEDGWEQIESIRFEGTLRLPETTLSFTAFKKKPDYCKIILFTSDDTQIIIAYDGTDAWQLNSGESQAKAMPPAEALNFIRDAPTAGHLLYPLLPGKQIELAGTCMVGDCICYDLIVTLPNGQTVRYAIDASSYIERQQTVLNAVSGATEVITHGLQQQLNGLWIPVESTKTIDGEFVYTVDLHHVDVNPGLMPWMFARPSGRYTPSTQMNPAKTVSLNVADETEGTQNPIDSINNLFGLEEDAFEPTRFPDLDDETMLSILEDIGTW